MEPRASLLGLFSSWNPVPHSPACASPARKTAGVSPSLTRPTLGPLRSQAPGCPRRLRPAPLQGSPAAPSPAPCWTPSPIHLPECLESNTPGSTLLIPPKCSLLDRRRSRPNRAGRPPPRPTGAVDSVSFTPQPRSSVAPLVTPPDPPTVLRLPTSRQRPLCPCRDTRICSGLWPPAQLSGPTPAPG